MIGKARASGLWWCYPLSYHKYGGRRLSRLGQFANWPTRAHLRKQMCGLDGRRTPYYKPPQGGNTAVYMAARDATLFLCGGSILWAMELPICLLILCI